MNLADDYSQLDWLEAIQLMQACKPLADYLHAAGYKAALDNDKRLILHTFRKLEKADWFKRRDDLRWAAGLDLDDVYVMGYREGLEQIERLRRLHAEGNG